MGERPGGLCDKCDEPYDVNTKNRCHGSCGNTVCDDCVYTECTGCDRTLCYDCPTGSCGSCGEVYCEGCWENIETHDVVQHDNSSTEMCEDCFEATDLRCSCCFY